MRGFETGIVCTGINETLRFVRLDRYCSVHEDGSIYVPSEVTTYWELVYDGRIEQEFTECRRSWLPA